MDENNQNVKKKSNGLAVASLVLGIMGILLICFFGLGIIFAIIGLILGLVSLKDGADGRGIAGIVLSCVTLVLVVLAIVLSLTLNTTSTTNSQTKNTVTQTTATQSSPEVPQNNETSSIVKETPKDKKDVDEKDVTDYKYITIKDIDIHCADLVGEKVMLVDVIKDYDTKERKIKVSVPDTFHYYIFSLAEDSIITPSKLKGKTVAVIGTIKENETKVFNDASVYDAYVVAIGNDANQYKQEATDIKLKDKFVLKPSEISDMSEEDYKANCTTFTSSDYNKILRNPNQYKDKLAKLSGKVNQTVEGLFGLYTYIYIKDNNGNLWGINYTYGENESHKLDGDSITVWGNLDGTTTVDNVLGVQKTLPYISAKYIK